MKRLLFLILFINSICIAQTIKTEEKTIKYKSGRAFLNICVSNPEIEFDEKLEYRWYRDYMGTQKTKGGASGNLLHGNYQFINKQGKLLYEHNYYLGLQHGIQKEWNDEGEVIKTFKFDKGVMIYYKYPSENWDGAIEEMIGIYLDEGCIINYYVEGVLRRKEVYLNNALRKSLIQYHINGNTAFKTTRNAFNEDDGEYSFYYDNGQLKVQGEHKNGDRSSVWKWYKEDGTPDDEEIYKYDEIRRNDNTLEMKGTYFYDDELEQWQKHGTWKYYNGAGNGFSGTKTFEYGVEVIQKSN